MIAVLPAVIPDITPVVLLAVATEMLPLVQIPPGTPSLNVTVRPWQALVEPVIAGKEITVSELLTEHPAGDVYVIIADPVVMAYSMPVEGFMVAIDGLLQVHVPPGVAFASVTVVPTHGEVFPVIGRTGFTFMVVVLKQPTGTV